jgi:hypothetical protein
MDEYGMTECSIPWSEPMSPSGSRSSGRRPAGARPRCSCGSRTAPAMRRRSTSARSWSDWPGDELGYMELDRRGAELLFQILTESEEKASVAMASNESSSKAHMFARTCVR